MTNWYFWWPLRYMLLAQLGASHLDLASVAWGFCGRWIQPPDAVVCTPAKEFCAAIHEGIADFVPRMDK